MITDGQLRPPVGRVLKCRATPVRGIPTIEQRKPSAKEMSY